VVSCECRDSRVFDGYVQCVCSSLAAVVCGSTAAVGWSSPWPRPDQRQRLKMMSCESCLNIP